MRFLISNKTSQTYTHHPHALSGHEKLNLLNQHTPLWTSPWKCLQEIRYCTRCLRSFTGFEVRVLSNGSGSRILTCATAGCESSPSEWQPPLTHAPQPPLEGTVIRKPDGDELIIQDSTLQQLMQAALNHRPLLPRKSPPWNLWLEPILHSLQDPSSCEEAWTGFMKLLSERPDLVQKSTRQPFHGLARALSVICHQLTQISIAPTELPLLTLANEGFYHGSIEIQEQFLIFFYFHQANMGLCRALTHPSQGDWMVRFQIVTASCHTDPESDHPLGSN